MTTIDGGHLLVLGAGPYQLPGIRKAVEAGVKVTTVDYLPDNVGHRVSHGYVNVSTTDTAGVVEAARQLGVDGVMTFASDVATMTVAQVAQALGLPGPRPDVVGRMTDKAAFRQFQHDAGLPAPDFLRVDAITLDPTRLEHVSFPVMFKPVDTSGSRGVTRVDAPDPQRVASALQYARAFSRSGVVCVESFVDGEEVGGDGFLRNGELVFLALTHKHKREFVVTGHSFPTNIDDAEQRAVRDAVAATCRALGYADGPINVDVIVANRGATVLEMSPRSGGNGIPMLVERATGVDVLRTCVDLALGRPAADLTMAPHVRPCGSLVFGSDHAGTVRAVADRQTLQARVPHVFDYFTSVRPGESVPAFEHNGASLGYVLFDLGGSRYDRMAADVWRALQLDVASDSSAA